MTCLNRAPPNLGEYYVESRHCPSLCDQQVRSLTAHIRCLRIIDFSSRQIAVAQPERDFSDVMRGLQHNHGRSMPQYMR